MTNSSVPKILISLYMYITDFFFLFAVIFDAYAIIAYMYSCVSFLSLNYVLAKFDANYVLPQNRLLLSYNFRH